MTSYQSDDRFVTIMHTVYLWTAATSRGRAQIAQVIRTVGVRKRDASFQPTHANFNLPDDLIQRQVFQFVILRFDNFSRSYCGTFRLGDVIG